MKMTKLEMMELMFGTYAMKNSSTYKRILRKRTVQEIYDVYRKMAEGIFDAGKAYDALFI